MRSQLAGRQPVEQPGRVTPAPESVTSKWLHAHVPTAAGTGCPAFQSTAMDRIWPRPWQRGGTFCFLAVLCVPEAPGHAEGKPSLGSELCRALLCHCKTVPSRGGAPDHWSEKLT